jgi:cyclic pyranopterin phosphate synthase
MPAEGIKLAPKSELLTFEEIARVVGVGAGLGLAKVRLTGGEPTVRHELPVLVRMLADIAGVRELSMTTNGARLDELAGPLKAAGLGRVNVSLDTLRRERAAELARRDVLPAVLRGIDAAVAAGLTPVKLNAVVMRGVNDDELADLVDFARERGAEMRFIEYMPMGVARLDEHNRTVAAREMLERLRGRFDLVPEDQGVCGPDHASDPARRWVCKRTGARVGFITSISDHFCGTCNRMRLTAEGGLRPCLHQDAEVDVRKVLRSKGTDEDVGRAFREAAGLKWAGHHMTAFVPLYSRKEMVAIGG